MNYLCAYTTCTIKLLILLEYVDTVTYLTKKSPLYNVEHFEFGWDIAPPNVFKENVVWTP